MKTYVINLKSEVERRVSMCHKLDQQNMKDVYFVEAVNGNEKDLRPYFDAKTSYSLYKRVLSKGEVGCAMSHLTICDLIIKSGEPAIVFEDDIIFTCTNNELANVELDFDFEVLFLNEPRCNKQPLNYKGKPTEYSLNGIAIEEITIPLVTPAVWWLGSSYILSPSGAEKVIKANWPIKHVADCWQMFNIEKGFKLEKGIVKQDKSWGSFTGNF